MFPDGKHQTLFLVFVVVVFLFCFFLIKNFFIIQTVLNIYQSTPGCGLIPEETERCMRNDSRLSCMNPVENLIVARQGLDTLTFHIEGQHL